MTAALFGIILVQAHRAMAHQPNGRDPLFVSPGGAVRPSSSLTLALRQQSPMPSKQPMSSSDETKTLERIRIQGLCSLADVELRPGRLTVLIGSNGSGKSNVLKALKLAPLLRTQSLGHFVGEAGGASALLHYGSKATPQIALDFEFKQDRRRNTYAVRLGFAGGDRLVFLDETVSYRDEQLDEEHCAQPPSPRSIGAGHFESRLDEVRKSDPTAKSVWWWLSRMSFFHFHDTSLRSQLRTNSRAGDDRYLRSDGSNLAAFLYRLKASEHPNEQAAWLKINDLVRRIAPCVKTLLPTLRATTSGNDSVQLHWLDDRDAQFGAHQLSDGTLRAIALITALAQPADLLPHFISIDEPELGLHPAAITLIAELARSVSHRCQVLFATQSTQFLDHFDPSEVVVVERKASATQLARPNVEQLASWLEDYRLSEVFDKGILGGRP